MMSTPLPGMRQALLAGHRHPQHLEAVSVLVGVVSATRQQ